MRDPMIEEFDAALDRLEGLVDRLETALLHGRGITPRRRCSSVDEAEAELLELFETGARVWWPGTSDGPLGRYSVRTLVRARQRLQVAGLIRKVRLGGGRGESARWVWQLCSTDD